MGFIAYLYHPHIRRLIYLERGGSDVMTYSTAVTVSDALHLPNKFRHAWICCPRVLMHIWYNVGSLRMDTLALLTCQVSSDIHGALHLLVIGGLGTVFDRSTKTCPLLTVPLVGVYGSVYSAQGGADAPSRRIRGCTPGSCSDPCCDWGPGKINYGTDGSLSQRCNPSRTTPPGPVFTYSRSNSPAPMRCGTGGSVHTYPPIPKLEPQMIWPCTLCFHMVPRCWC